MAIEVAQGANVMNVDASGSAAVTLRDTDGDPIIVDNSTPIDPSTQSGVMLSGADYKSAHLIRVSPDGTLRAGDDQPLFYDSCEGAAVDTNKWIQTATTMTIADRKSVV